MTVASIIPASVCNKTDMSQNRYLTKMKNRKNMENQYKEDWLFQKQRELEAQRDLNNRRREERKQNIA